MDADKVAQAADIARGAEGNLPGVEQVVAAGSDSQGTVEGNAVGGDDAAHADVGAVGVDGERGAVCAEEVDGDLVAGVDVEGVGAYGIPCGRVAVAAQPTGVVVGVRVVSAFGADDEGVAGAEHLLVFGADRTPLFGAHLLRFIIRWVGALLVPREPGAFVARRALAADGQVVGALRGEVAAFCCGGDGPGGSVESRGAEGLARGGVDRVAVAAGGIAQVGEHDFALGRMAEGHVAQPQGVDGLVVDDEVAVAVEDGEAGGAAGVGVEQLAGQVDARVALAGRFQHDAAGGGIEVGADARVAQFVDEELALRGVGFVARQRRLDAEDTPAAVAQGDDFRDVDGAQPAGHAAVEVQIALRGDGDAAGGGEYGHACRVVGCGDAGGAAGDACLVL